MGKQRSDGKGRLTDAIISKLTTFYGNAIRANSHNVNEMRQAVWAVWTHTSSTDMSRNIGFAQQAKIAGFNSPVVRHQTSGQERLSTEA
ncbi:hypothetical protein TNCV_4228321 [Trichonephila clavipes]|nr:hypothetical protein TNCV_4228321 [Trichonephila clavipes]